MSDGEKFLCPFCIEENSPDAAVCRVCHRDIAIPFPLRAEHQELSRKREQLRLELDRAKAGLESGSGPARRWLGI
jgi:ribosomal protein L40E